MFKFNFNKDEAESPTDEITTPSTTSPSPAMELILNEPLTTKVQKAIDEMPQGNVSQLFGLTYLSGPIFEYETLKDMDHTDLTPQVYEGGYKIWECTFDLLSYLKEHVDLGNSGVLDLGCGAGLLGLYALSHGSTNVCFQDYNREVVESLTLPNILLNKASLDTCKLYYGDWGGLGQTLQAQFDVILTSETIYNVDNYAKLISLFKHVLKPNGVIYLAAKVYYFGVGGCVYEFEKNLQENGFVTRCVWEMKEGVCRKIVEIRHKSVQS